MPTPVEKNNRETARRFTAALGEYVTTTANCESVFIAILHYAFLDPSDAVLVLWFQTTSTRARLEMVKNVCRAKWGPIAATKEVEAFAARFRSLARQRNLFCHAHYHPMPDGSTAYTGFEIVDSDTIIKVTRRRITKGTCNEVERSTMQMASLTNEIWDFVRRLEKRALAAGVIDSPIVLTPPQDHQAQLGQ